MQAAVFPIRQSQLVCSALLPPQVSWLGAGNMLYVGRLELSVQAPRCARQSGGTFVHEAAHCQARCAPGDAALRVLN